MKSIRNLLLVVSIFHFKVLLGSQVRMRITPCDFVNHSSYLYEMYPHYKELYPDMSPLPLSRGEDFPIEYYLHHSVPQKYRHIFYEVASEWNRVVVFKAFTIKDEIDHSEMDPNQGIKDSKNVIYWFNEDQYIDFIPSEYGLLRVVRAAKTFIEQGLTASRSYVFISEIDMDLHEKGVTVMGQIYAMFTLNLEIIGVEPPEEMDGLGLQKLFVEHLSNMNQDDFYDMILRYRLSKGFKPPSDASRQNIQDRILQDINMDMPSIGPLNSFEDLHDLLIREYSFDITEFLDDTTLLKNYVRHEFGHAFGLKHHRFKGRLMEEFLLNRVILLPRHLLAPKAIDELAYFGLLCTYDLGHLMQTKPL